MKKYLIFATIVAMVFVGCKKNTTAPPKKPTEKPVAAKFSGNISKGSILEGNVTTTISTRVSERGEWEAKDKIGVFMFANEQERNETNVLTKNAKYEFLSTQSLTTDEGTVNGAIFGANLENTIYFPAKKKVDFIAYFPYIEDMSPTVRLITADFSEPEKKNAAAEGFYWAEAIGQSEESPNVKFTFKRVQSLVNINLSSVTESIKAADLEGATFKLIGVPTIGVFDIIEGKIKIPENKHQPRSVTYTGYSIHLPPHTNERYGNRWIEVTLKNQRVYTVPLKINIVSGRSHWIAIKIQDDVNATIESSIEKWSIESLEIIAPLDKK
ncbi:hypothetical protein BN938_2162 [Mucinivorans hirudinis]|uniref:Fimbrillin family protein n=1 Tax=Mucinivorans hirudinis TaxID=1433126 RepID=A0A060R9E5_9BACT|nr:hypothetical protein BN938_2162 [Mucinivorans hirudinis]